MIHLSPTPAQLGLICGALAILANDAKLQRKRGITRHEAIEARQRFYAAAPGQGIALSADLGRIIQLEMHEFIDLSSEKDDPQFARNAQKVIDTIEDQL